MSTAPVMAREIKPIPGVIAGECFLLDEFGSFIVEKELIQQSYEAARYWSRVFKCTVVAYRYETNNQSCGWKPFISYKNGISQTPGKRNPHKKGGPV